MIYGPKIERVITRRVAKQQAPAPVRICFVPWHVTRSWMSLRGHESPGQISLYLLRRRGRGVYGIDFASVYTVDDQFSRPQFLALNHPIHVTALA